LISGKSFLTDQPRWASFKTCWIPQ
jgi:hypothetical protein